MKRRKWEPKTKATIVLEGLNGKPVGAIHQDYQISQAQYYQWRDQFLANAPKTFEVAQQTDCEARRSAQNTRLKRRRGCWHRSAFDRIVRAGRVGRYGWIGSTGSSVNAGRCLLA